MAEVIRSARQAQNGTLLTGSPWLYKALQLRVDKVFRTGAIACLHKVWGALP